MQRGGVMFRVKCKSTGKYLGGYGRGPSWGVGKFYLKRSAAEEMMRTHIFWSERFLHTWPDNPDFKTPDDLEIEEVYISSK